MMRPHPALVTALIGAVAFYGFTVWLERKAVLAERARQETEWVKQENEGLRRNIAVREEMNEIRSNRPDGAGVAECLQRPGCF